jgi:hypothetical protein
MTLPEISEVKTAAEATQIAIDYQNWASDQSLSYGEVSEYSVYFEALAGKFALTEDFSCAPDRFGRTDWHISTRRVGSVSVPLFANNKTMAHSSDESRTTKAYDRRIKIPIKEYPAIIARYKSGEFIRAIARAYKVDKRLIQFILFPERKEKNIADRKATGGSKQYYNKDKWREVMREHRAYKKSLINRGVI